VYIKKKILNEISIGSINLLFDLPGYNDFTPVEKNLELLRACLKVSLK